MVIFHLGSLNHPSYEVNINLYGLKLPPGVGIRNVVFTVSDKPIALILNKLFVQIIIIN